MQHCFNSIMCLIWIYLLNVDSMSAIVQLWQRFQFYRCVRFFPSICSLIASSSIKNGRTQNIRTFNKQPINHSNHYTHSFILKATATDLFEAAKTIHYFAISNWWCFFLCISAPAPAARTIQTLFSLVYVKISYRLTTTTIQSIHNRHFKINLILCWFLWCVFVWFNAVFVLAFSCGDSEYWALVYSESFSAACAI